MRSEPSSGAQMSVHGCRGSANGGERLSRAECWDEDCLLLISQELGWLNTMPDLGGRSRIRTWVGLRRRIYSPCAGVPVCCPLSQRQALTCNDYSSSSQPVCECLTRLVTTL